MTFEQLARERPDEARRQYQELLATGGGLPPAIHNWALSQGLPTRPAGGAPAPVAAAAPAAGGRDPELESAIDAILGPSQGGAMTPQGAMAQARPGGAYDFGGSAFTPAPPMAAPAAPQGLPGREDRLDINGTAPPPPTTPWWLPGSNVRVDHAGQMSIVPRDPVGGEGMTAFNEGGRDMLSASTWDEIQGAMGGDVEAVRAYQDDLRTRFPGQYMGGQVMGGLATTLIPGGTAAAGAGVGARLGAAAIAGGLPMAAYGAGSGTTPMERIQNAGVMGAVGTGIGMVAPTLGRLAGGLVGGAVRWAKGGAGTPAQRIVTEAITSDAAVPAAVNQLGPEGILADIGPNTQQLAAVVAATPGPGQQLVRNTLKTRAAGAGARVEGDINAAMPSANIPRTMEALDSARKLAAAPLYRAAYATPINGASQVFQDILATPGGTQAWRSAVRLAANEGTQLDRNFLTVQAVDYIKRALDDQISVARRAGQSQLVRALEGQRVALLAEVDTQVPVFAQARAAYAGPSAMMQAMEEGQTVFSSTISPDQLRIVMSRMSQSERDAYTLGARQQVSQIMGSARNDAAAAIRELAEKGWNKEKLTILLGRKEAAQVIQAMERERTFAGTAYTATGSAETARRLLGESMTNQSSKAGNAFGAGTMGLLAFQAGGPIGLLGAGGVALLTKFVRQANSGQFSQLAGQVGQILSAQGPQRQQLVNALTQIQQQNAGNTALVARVSKLLGRALPAAAVGGGAPPLAEGVDGAATSLGFR